MFKTTFLKFLKGYVSEIEDLRAQLMESNALYEASRKREARERTRHDSSLVDASSILDDAKRELYKVCIWTYDNMFILKW